MPRPSKSLPRPAARVGGYLRVSVVQFPPGCRSVEQRLAHVDDMRRVRRAELVADAARHGDEITVWYDDMGVSGRGEFLERRTDFERARADARAGDLRCLYARDLSRFFRDLVQQELWFIEMEDCGVEVRAEDLPQTADPSTRRLLRQQLGAIHEYQSSRQGAIIRASLRERVKAGLWVGQAMSHWGLHYDSSTKGFAFDPDTADRIRLVFETFTATRGNAGAAARRLNLMVRDGAPRSTRAPWGADWKADLVLQQVRSPLYRRVVAYTDIERHSPDLIPEVVPPALVAEVDRLLEDLRPYYDACARSHVPHHEPYVYLGLLRCAACGYAMRAARSVDAGGRPEDRWVSWRCGKSSGRGYEAGDGCDVTFAARQPRVDALAAKALERAFRDYAYRYTPPARPGGPGRADLRPAALIPAIQLSLAKIGRRRDRYLEMYATGLVSDKDVLQPHLDRLADEEAYLKARIETLDELRGTAAQPVPPPLAPDAFARVREGFERAWASPGDPLRGRPRRDFLQGAGASFRVEFHPREPKGPRAPNNMRRYGGRITLTLDLPLLGITGARALSVTESAAPATRRGVPSPPKDTPTPPLGLLAPPRDWDSVGGLAWESFEGIDHGDTGAPPPGGSAEGHHDAD